MKLTKKKEIDAVVGIECDCCKKEFLAEDTFEIQEFFHIKNACGYGSIFGDGNYLEVDICQSCMKTIIETNCGNVDNYIKESEVYE